MATKQERLAEFYRRLKMAEPPSNSENAYALLCSTLDAVEDELTGLPNDPSNWKQTGRLYPPQNDRMCVILNGEVKRYDSARHFTYIAANGAIEIRELWPVDGKPKVEFSMPGSDGKHVCDIHPSLSKTNL